MIHGDPHLGNYTVFERDGRAAGINLLDYGCMRTFRVPFVQGVVDLYTGLLEGKQDLVVTPTKRGVFGATKELIEAMNIWAHFIYGPPLEDRERTIAEGTTPGEYGRREAFTVHRILREKGPVVVPREFVFMDRAAIGLGGVFLHLGAPQLVPPLQRDDRGFQHRRGLRAPARDVRRSRWPPSGIKSGEAGASPALRVSPRALLSDVGKRLGALRRRGCAGLHARCRPAPECPPCACSGR